MAGKGFSSSLKCIIGRERGMRVHSAGEVCGLRLSYDGLGLTVVVLLQLISPLPRSGAAMITQWDYYGRPM